MESVWIMDYDLVNDETYDRPGCPECLEPIGKKQDGHYYCFSCGQDVDVNDPEMIRWFADRAGEKIEMSDCIRYEIDGYVCGCGGKGCMETHFVRNHITLEWQPAYGKCRNCGKRFIV